MLSKIEKSLLDKYKAIFKENRIPGWAFDYKPPIPFVGSKIERRKPRVLLYASAENLQYLKNDKKSEVYYKGEKAWFRHKCFLEDDGFPYIGIGPIENMSLLTAARYLLYKLGISGHCEDHFSKKPSDFLNEIAIGNISKFSIKAEKNIDPTTWDELEKSMEYIKADLIAIKPDIVILPKTKYQTIDNHIDIRKFFHIDKKLIVINIFQTVPQVMNLHIGSYNRISYDGHFINDWLKYMLKLEKHLKDFGRYLHWVDDNFDSIVSVI